MRLILRYAREHTHTYIRVSQISHGERRVEGKGERGGEGEGGNYEESLRVLMSYLDVRAEVVRGLNSQGHDGDVEREGGGLF